MDRTVGDFLKANTSHIKTSKGNFVPPNNIQLRDHSPIIVCVVFIYI